MKKGLNVFLIVIVVIQFSCSEKKDNNDIINRDTMVQILSDMEMARAIITISGNDKKPDREVLFNKIYQNHHTTKEKFEHSLLHYSKKPKEIEQMYNDVITILSQKQASLQ